MPHTAAVFRRVSEGAAERIGIYRAAFGLMHESLLASRSANWCSNLIGFVDIDWFSQATNLYTDDGFFFMDAYV